MERKKSWTHGIDKKKLEGDGLKRTERDFWTTDEATGEVTVEFDVPDDDTDFPDDSNNGNDK